MPREQLIASFDLETSNLDPMFGILLCGVIKPWGQEAKLFRKARRGSDDSKVVQDVIAELNKYTVLIGHNGLWFDKRFINGRALRWNTTLLNPKVKIYDPWKIAKTHLNFRGNSLARLSDFLGTEHEKTAVSGDIWMKATLDGDKGAMDYICDHCIEDVEVLEEVAYRLREFMGNITSWGSA